MSANDVGTTLADLSIVIVNWNTRDLLKRCLQSISQIACSRRIETIVVDNGSSDGSVDMVSREFPSVKLILNPDNRGFARANNQAIRVSTGRYILLLNSDAVLLDGTVDCLEAFLDACPGAGIVGGKLLNSDGSFQASYNDFPSLAEEFLLLTGLSRLLLPKTFPSYPEAQSQECRQVDWVGGACLMVRRTAVNAIGLLDEDYFMYAEEMDWCYRMKQGGWGVYYLPDAVIVHGSGESFRRVPEYKRAHVYRGKVIYMRKHGGRFRAAILRFLVQVVSVCKMLAWQPLGLSPDPVRRRRSRQQVASYRLLLAHL